jgi:hypothetical protein
VTNVNGVTIHGELKSAAITGDVTTVMRILNEHKKSVRAEYLEKFSSNS